MAECHVWGGPMAEEEANTASRQQLGIYWKKFLFCQSTTIGTGISEDLSQRGHGGRRRVPTVTRRSVDG